MRASASRCASSASGSGERRFEAWGYRARSVDLRGVFSAVLSLDSVAARVDVSGGARRTKVDFSDDAARVGWDPVCV